MLSKLNLVIYS